MQTSIWTWETCSKRTYILPIPNSSACIPVTIICGTSPGPSVLISGGIHNAEYVGIQAAIELANELKPEEINGSIAIIHLMNPSGFMHRTNSLVYEDGKNLNRVFPGCSDGTTADKIAHLITNMFIKEADAYIDLHCGDCFEELTPYVYCQGVADQSTVKISREMADLVDVPYLVTSKVSTGGAYNYAGSIGVPGILIERGCLGLWTPEEVEADKKDVRNILRYLGSLGGEMETQMQVPVELSKIIYADSSLTGCWYPRKKAGQNIKQGEILGEIRDFFGNTLQVCTAEFEGVLLYQTKSLNIIKNDIMVAYGSIPEYQQNRSFVDDIIN